MAGPPCMSEDGNAAVFVGTMLQTGDAVALCDECLVPWCASVLAVMTGLDPTPFLMAVSEDTQEQITTPDDHDQNGGPPVDQQTGQAPPAEPEVPAASDASQPDPQTPPMTVGGSGRTPRKRSSDAAATGTGGGDD